MTDEMTFREKVLDAVSGDDNKRVIPITFPSKAYRRFRSWSEANANGTFWLAIERLLDHYEGTQGADLGTINDRIDFLTQVVANLEQEIIVLKQEKNTKTIKTFGRKEE